MEDPPKKFFRLAPGREVRLRYAYFVTCREVVKDATGEVVELRCSYDPRRAAAMLPTAAARRRRCTGSRRKRRCRAEVRLYEHLFTRPDPGAEGDLLADLNPASEELLKDALVEPAAASLPVGETLQFERLGYFCLDPDSRPGRPVFNRTPHAQGHLGEGAGQRPAERVAATERLPG
jgi:glutaminyl-tRNA synthetase